MRTRDYVDAVVRRSGIVMVVILAALMIGSLIFFVSPRKYRAVATVVVPAPGSEVTSLIAGSTQSMNDFESAVGSEAVADRVSLATGLPTDEVKAGLSFKRIAGGSIAEVTFVGTDPAKTQEVARLISKDALILLLEARAAPFREQEAIAGQAYGDANDAYQQFEQETGILSPDTYFRLQTSRLVALNDRLGVARNSGDTSLADKLQAEIDKKQEALARDLVRYQQLDSAIQRALAGLTDAEHRRTIAEAALKSVEGDAEVNLSRVAPIPRLKALGSILIPIAVISTALAIAFVLLLEIVVPFREPKAAGSAEPRPTT